jgi:O-antigen ligase
MSNIKINRNSIRLSLLVIFTFSMPNSVTLNDISLISIVIFWLFYDDKKSIIEIVKTNKIAQLSLLYFISNIFALLWTENIARGLEMILKEKEFLLLPIFMSLIKDNEKELLIKTFLTSMFISEAISYSVKFEIIAPIFKATVYEPIPFISHIHYSPYAAFTSYILMYFVLFREDRSKIEKAIALFFWLTISINLFMTGGRAGQVVYFILVIILLFQYFKLSIKTFLLATILLPSIFIIAYNTSTIFKNRVDITIHNLNNYEQHKSTSIGLRITTWKNSIEIIKEHPLLGVGGGDYIDEYKKMNMKNSPNESILWQPHNMYLTSYLFTGLFGFIIFLILLIALLYYAINIHDRYRPMREAFILYYIVIMFSESYLLNHNGKIMFMIFISILFNKLRSSSENCDS